MRNHAENDAGRPDPSLFLFFEKALYKAKVSVQHFSFDILWSTSTWTYKKNELYNISYG